MQVVSNTSPLSALSIIGRLGLLHERFGTVRIPEAVWIELARLDHVSGKQALVKARAEGWLEVHKISYHPMAGVLAVTLDAGESEAIAMSLEWPADLLIMDESSGRAMARNLKVKLTGGRCTRPLLRRAMARNLKVKLTGTLGLLLQAKRSGRIPSLKFEMDRLVQDAGFFVSDRIRNTFLAEAGESP